MKHRVTATVALFSESAFALNGRTRYFGDETLPSRPPDGPEAWYFLGLFFGGLVLFVVYLAVKDKLQKRRARIEALKEAEQLPDPCYSAKYYEWTYKDDTKPWGYCIYYRIGSEFKFELGQYDKDDKPFPSRETASMQLEKALANLGIPRENEVASSVMESLHSRINA